ncbi:hypothetical protein PU345_002109 [Enterobacter kobei]|nr:hypothetical protein [Enterobacter kobei]
MEENICSCRGCCKKLNKKDMHYRKSEYYPYRSDYYCAACTEQKDKRNALKTAQARVRKPSISSFSLFK